ncbi:uncharacterized protein N7496_005098 [Penicillium cataractarum]|uniref:Integral membrane protein n=1 Tax=Penicillium cataractarum TaxID=2100454 RepID=A0A9W9SI40_9EURO|nr:uncharacterized protein N7496_005098 [Penicillium cataractarum]KAJ5377689.1 integral membrane protein [Penicillium cataractarum]
MAAKLPGEDEFIKIVVENLRKKEKHDGDDSQKHEPVEIYVTSDYTLEELWRTIEEELEIVSDKSAADETHIYINESLHAAAHRDQSVKFDIEYNDQGQTSLIIDNALQLVFHRTVRMPDDDRLHSLPGSVGNFPLYNTEDYTDRLPENILEKGGLFLPMWQREALWIELRRSISSHTVENSNQIYAIRVYVGQINAVSGKNMMDEGGTQQEQDYLIFPGQPWIDGICVAPGVVRQFVAMPLGSGYTVEGQKTGEEKHGGLQIEIIPAYSKKAQKWLAATEEEALQDPGLYLDESKTPAQLRLEAGSQVRAYPSPPTYCKPVEVGDLYRVKKDSCLGVVNLEAFYYDHWDLSDWGGAPRVRGPGSRAMSDMPELRPPSRGLSTITFQSLSKDTTAASSMGEAYLDEHSGAEVSLGIPPRRKPPPAKRKTKARGPGRGALKATLQTSEVKSPPPQVLNVKAMGLAAGGKLVQDIIADHNPPNTWNIDAARLINIHILDPVSCESVTHIVPPPIPMSAYEAVLSNLPFFVVEEQIDNRLEGGDFDNVKSVTVRRDCVIALFGLAIINFATCASEQ